MLCLAALLAAVLGTWQPWRPAGALEQAQQLYARGDLSAAWRIAAKETTNRVESLTLQANCARRLGRSQQFATIMAELEKLDAPSYELARELLQVQQGGTDESPTRLLRQLERSGADPLDARSVVILGMLARGDSRGAASQLEQFANDPQFVAAAQLGYLESMAFRFMGRSTQAERRLARNISEHPTHEESYAALAEWLREPPDVRLAAATKLYELMATNFPDNTMAPVRLARIQRQIGQLQAAEESLQTAPENNELLLEQAEVALDSGDYARAAAAVRESGLETADDFGSLTDRALSLTLNGQTAQGQILTRRVNWAATALALNGDSDKASEVFEVALDRVARVRRLVDLRVKQQLYPGAQAIVDEMNNLTSPAFAPRHPTLPHLSPAPRADEMEDGKAINASYLRHCAECHGASGDGLGRAARHLTPRPRNLRREPMRYVSGGNGVATDEDLARTIQQGLPGVSMPGFPELPASELNQIVSQIRAFRREGLSQEFEQMSQRGDLPEASREDWINARLLPEQSVMLPEGAASGDPDRGSQLFRSIGCQNCHSVDGSPSATRLFHDSLGRPLLARNLTREPFRGGRRPVDVFRRIVLGIPGTPHPAAGGLSDAEAVDLTAYVLSLSDTQTSKHTNASRRQALNAVAGPSSDRAELSL